MSGRVGRHAVLGVALGLGLFSFLFLPELRQGRVFAYRDAVYYHLPMSRLVSAELREGRMPFWNPVIACGTPLAANPNNYVWYPTRLLELVASPETALSLHFFLHWIGGGVAMALLAASFGLSVPATAAAALLALLGGPALSLLNFANLAPYLLWTPLTLLALRSLARAPGPRPAAGLAVCLAFQTTFVEPTFLFVEVVAAAAVLLAGGGRDPGDAAGAAPGGATAGAGRALAWAAAAGGIALLVAAPMWIPLLELVASSARGADARASLGSSVPPIALWQLPVPQFFGDYHTLEKRHFWGEIFNEGKGPFFLSISFGAAALAAVAGGLVGRTRAATPLFLAGLLGVLLAMGPYFPPLRGLAAGDAAGWFRWPVKFTFLAAMTWPLVAALGVDALGRGSRRAVVGTAAAALALAAAAVYAAGGVGGPDGSGWVGRHVAPLAAAKDVAGILAQVEGRLLRAAVFAGAVALLAGFVALLGAAGRGAAVRGTATRGAARGTALAAGLLTALIAADLAPPQRAVNSSTPLEILRMDTPILRQAREVAAAGYRVHFPRNLWDVSLPRTPGLPDEWWPRTRLDRELGNFYHAIGEPVPMVLLNPDRLIGEGAAERGRSHPLLGRRDQDALLQLVGVAATVAAGPPALLPGRSPVSTSAGFPVALVRDADAVPIAAWTDELPPEEGAPWSGPFVRAAREHWRLHGSPAAVTVRERSPGRWQLDVETDRPGWVTLTETRDPGWSVRVDGEPGDVVPYLADFSAVRVPAGAHRVDWVYRPPHLTGWLVASAAGWLLVAGLVTRRRKGTA